jgi:hypothetical protein
MKREEKNNPQQHLFFSLSLLLRLYFFCIHVHILQYLCTKRERDFISLLSKKKQNMKSLLFFFCECINFFILFLSHSLALSSDDDGGVQSLKKEREKVCECEASREERGGLALSLCWINLHMCLRVFMYYFYLGNWNTGTLGAHVFIEMRLLLLATSDYFS